MQKDHLGDAYGTGVTRCGDPAVAVVAAGGAGVGGAEAGRPLGWRSPCPCPCPYPCVGPWEKMSCCPLSLSLSVTRNNQSIYSGCCFVMEVCVRSDQAQRRLIIIIGY